MQTKLKICAGFDGNSHEAYIYKNIKGKKYCKSCAFKLSPPKSINKVSEKQTFKIILKKRLLEEDKNFYLEVWYERFGRIIGTGEKYGSVIDNAEKLPVCECCGERLYFEPNLTYFHHILEKRNYPRYRHEKWNIAIVCSNCHNKYETYPDSVPYLVELRDKLLREKDLEFEDYKIKVFEELNIKQNV